VGQGGAGSVRGGAGRGRGGEGVKRGEVGRGVGCGGWGGGSGGGRGRVPYLLRGLSPSLASAPDLKPKGELKQISLQAPQHDRGTVTFLPDSLELAQEIFIPHRRQLPRVQRARFHCLQYMVESMMFGSDLVKQGPFNHRVFRQVLIRKQMKFARVESINTFRTKHNGWS